MSKKSAAAPAADAEGQTVAGGKPAPAVAPDPFAHQGDEHWGTGGRFVVEDGKRVPAPVTTDTEADHA